MSVYLGRQGFVAHNRVADCMAESRNKMKVTNHHKSLRASYNNIENDFSGDFNDKGFAIKSSMIGEDYE